MAYHSRATAKLLSGRISVAGASYFLTCCTHNRARMLDSPSVLATTRTAIAGVDDSQDGVLLAASIMPDHVHLLLTLGERLTVSRIVAKAKAAVTREHPSVHWQLNFFEHRIREAAAQESFAFYIFMNPYAAGLCSTGETWPGWMPSRQIRWLFEGKLREGRFPHSEWLQEAARFALTLPAGAD